MGVPPGRPGVLAGSRSTWPLWAAGFWLRRTGRGQGLAGRGQGTARGQPSASAVPTAAPGLPPGSEQPGCGPSRPGLTSHRRRLPAGPAVFTRSAPLVMDSETGSRRDIFFPGNPRGVPPAFLLPCLCSCCCQPSHPHFLKAQDPPPPSRTLEQKARPRRSVAVPPPGQGPKCLPPSAWAPLAWATVTHPEVGVLGNSSDPAAGYLGEKPFPPLERFPVLLLQAARSRGATRTRARTETRRAHQGIAVPWVRFVPLGLPSLRGAAAQAEGRHETLPEAPEVLPRVGLGTAASKGMEGQRLRQRWPPMACATACRAAPAECVVGEMPHCRGRPAAPCPGHTAPGHYRPPCPRLPGQQAGRRRRQESGERARPLRRWLSGAWGPCPGRGHTGWGRGRDSLLAGGQAGVDTRSCRLGTGWGFRGS